MLVPVLTVYVETVIRREPLSQKGGGSKGNVLPCNMLCMISAIDHSSLSDVKREGSRMLGRWGGLSRKESAKNKYFKRERWLYSRPSHSQPAVVPHIHVHGGTGGHAKNFDSREATIYSICKNIILKLAL